MLEDLAGKEIATFLALLGTMISVLGLLGTAAGSVWYIGRKLGSLDGRLESFLRENHSAHAEMRIELHHHSSALTELTKAVAHLQGIHQSWSRNGLPPHKKDAPR